MYKSLLFLLVVAAASASTVTLRNDSPSIQVMHAQGLSVVLAVEVPANSSVTVDVGEGLFDRDHFLYGFCAGFTLMAPFIAWGIIRRMFQEAS